MCSHFFMETFNITVQIRHYIRYSSIFFPKCQFFWACPKSFLRKNCNTGFPDALMEPALPFLAGILLYARLLYLFFRSLWKTSPKSQGRKKRRNLSKSPLFLIFFSVGFKLTVKQGRRIQMRSVPQVFLKLIRDFQPVDRRIPWRWWEQP